MGQGPESGTNPPPTSPGTARIVDTVNKARKQILRAIAAATLLILVVLAYMWWTHPFTKCQRLADVRGPEFSEEQDAAWRDHECEKWPGIP